MKTAIVLTVVLLALCHLAAAELPTGQETPEGVACDAVMAYARCDSKAWQKTLIRPIFGEENNKKYADFKKRMSEETDKNKTNENFSAPKVLKCFQSRQFSKNGPGSLAYALHGLTANQFVDILIEVAPGKTQNIRYHVLRDKDGKWYFDPRPDLASLLAAGLNEEPESTKVIYERQ